MVITKIPKNCYLTPIKEYVTKTNVYEVRELRFEGSEDFARIFPLHDCCGRKCVRIKCYLDGEFESDDDVYGDFENMTLPEAYRLAKELCVYFE